jgi:hypothetical protein
MVATDDRGAVLAAAELHHPPGGRPHYVLAVPLTMTAPELESALDRVAQTAPGHGIYARPLVWLVHDTDPPAELAQVARAFRLAVRTEWSTPARLERLRQLQEAAR